MRVYELFRLLLVAALLIGGSVAITEYDTVEPVMAGDDDDRDDDRGRGNRGDNRGRGNDREVVTIAGYRVDVSCDFDGASGFTTCAFLPMVPDGGKEVSFFIVPQDVVCAAVAGGDGRYVDPDSAVDVDGYRLPARGNNASTLLFEGQVETHGEATYWVKAADVVHPATGPGLACETEESLGVHPDSTEATPPPTTGRVVVEVHACNGLNSESKDADWFGMCTEQPGEHRFLLEPVDDANATLLAAGTAGTGAAIFEDVEPAAYHFEDADHHWCHATSDRVTEAGHVVVEAGETTTVWLFYCGDGRE